MSGHLSEGVGLSPDMLLCVQYLNISLKNPRPDTPPDGVYKFPNILLYQVYSMSELLSCLKTHFFEYLCEPFIFRMYIYIYLKCHPNVCEGSMSQHISQGSMSKHISEV